MVQAFFWIGFSVLVVTAIAYGAIDSWKSKDMESFLLISFLIFGGIAYQLHMSGEGDKNPALLCPHCNTKGKVSTRTIKAKKGISGAKATGAILTGGLSVLAVGLSRKENTTQAHCSNCGMRWNF
jgi:hypothetical protein